MTSITTSRDRGRAAFLAAMMVLSVVAMSAAFTGGVAASGDVEYDLDDPWQGQTIVAQSDAIEPNEVYDLRSVDGYDGTDVDGTSLQEQLVADENGDLTIETDDLEAGDYIISADGIDEVRDNTFEVRVQSLDAAFEDSQVTDEGQDAMTDLELDSNRGIYSLNVSADGDLDTEELLSIFAGEENVEDALEAENRASIEDGELVPGDAQFGPFNVAAYADDEDDADETVVLVDTTDDDAPVSFAGIDDGAYDVEFESVDTEAVATSSVTVNEQDVDAEFDENVYTQSAGDIVEFTIDLEDTDNAYVQFGDEDAGYVDVLYIEDDSDNGEVTVQVNTRMAGTPGTDTDEAFHSEDDIVQSLVHSGGDEVEAATFYDEEVDPDNRLVGDFTTYLEELDLIGGTDDADEQLTRPLQPADYDLTVNANGNFVVDNGVSDVDNEIGFATLSLATPGVESIDTHVAPSDDADAHDRDELRELLTDREEIAEDDQLIIHAEASGLYGAMVAHEGDWDALDDGFSADTLHEITDLDGEGISFEAEATDSTGNQDPTSLVLENAAEEDVFVFADNDAGELYIVVDTSSSDAFDRTIEDGDTFTAELAYETDSDHRYEFDTGAFDGGANGIDDPAYPYFGTNDDQSVTTTFTIVEPSATFDDAGEDDVVQLETSGELVVTGETNVAPGTQVDVFITNAGDTPSFLTNPDATIDGDGSFETETIDFSERATDEEAAIDFRTGGSPIDSADGLFVEQTTDDGADNETDDASDATDNETDDTPAEPADDDASGGESDESAESDEADEADDESDDSTADDSDDETDSVPGFGLAVALAALLGGALLALRR
ncbi:BGTF surface domain-containing protein [Natrialbaceae archaeon A-arb3/5]